MVPQCLLGGWSSPGGGDGEGAGSAWPGAPPGTLTGSLSPELRLEQAIQPPVGRREVSTVVGVRAPGGEGWVQD